MKRNVLLLCATLSGLTGCAAAPDTFAELFGTPHRPPRAGWRTAVRAGAVFPADDNTDRDPGVSLGLGYSLAVDRFEFEMRGVYTTHELGQRIAGTRSISDFTLAGLFKLRLPFELYEGSRLTTDLSFGVGPGWRFDLSDPAPGHDIRDDWAVVAEIAFHADIDLEDAVFRFGLGLEYRDSRPRTRGGALPHELDLGDLALTFNAGIWF